ncbi:hypothetical protein Acsp01_10010 [Actinoplanes sp. NBRC 101535]|nr:hypothetical protein Acsp01_10010 [Actinoplanes sp. NBRC 101535]
MSPAAEQTTDDGSGFANTTRLKWIMILTVDFAAAATTSAGRLLRSPRASVPFSNSLPHQGRRRDRNGFGGVPANPAVSHGPPMNRKRPQATAGRPRAVADG